MHPCCGRIKTTQNSADIAVSCQRNIDMQLESCGHYAGQLPLDVAPHCLAAAAPKALLHRCAALHPSRQQRRRSLRGVAASAFTEGPTGQQPFRRAPQPSMLERSGELLALLQEIGTAAVASGPIGLNRYIICCRPSFRREPRRMQSVGPIMADHVA